MATPSALLQLPDTGVGNGRAMPRGYYSISEAAALLGVSRVTVWRWVSSGRLPVSRLGHRTVRVAHADLEQFVRPGLDGQAPLAPVAGTHLVLFYEADDFLVHGAVEFLGPAFERGEQCVVVATRAHRESIEQRLGLAGIDVAAAVASGKCVMLDAADTLERLMVDGLPDATQVADLAAALVNTRRTRIFGEMVALLAAEGNFEGALALEELWNKAQSKHPFSLLCGYPIGDLGEYALASVFVDVCGTHSKVVPTESYSRLARLDERLRAIVALQQKAASLERALAAERAARDQTEAALRTREEFLSIASHELRTPITVISAQAQLELRRMEEKGDVDAQQLAQALRTMGDQANRMGRLVSHLLDVSRIDTGKLEIEPRPTDLVQLVEPVVSVTRTLTDRHTISLVAPASLECVVDSLRIEQVVTNLLDNAVKYSPEGGSIDVVVEGTTDVCVEVSVRDHGLGIPEDRRDRIFERFYQAHGGPAQIGVGLGLYVCRHIVEQHGGAIRAEFPEDGGTRFVVRLPVANATARAAAV